MHRLCMWLLLGCASVLAAATWSRADDKSAGPGERLLGTTKVVSLQLSLAEKPFAALAPVGGGGPFGPRGFGPGGRPALPAETDETHRNTFGVEFPWSRGDLTWDGRTLSDVGLRYKGNYTFMATARSLKKSFKIDLNRHVAGQKLDGLTMLNLHCGVSDPTRAREAFSFATFRDLGVPAPRTSFAELTLTVPGKYDQELVGVYTVTEQVNKAFLKRHFQDGTGMLLKPEGLQGGPTYLGENWKAYAERYKPDDEPTQVQKQRLIDFTKLITSSDEETFARDIGAFLDLEAFLRFIAANALMSNLDSYLGFGHNYYLYLVPKSNHFVFIPWDLDLSLATWPAVGTPEQLVELSLAHPHAGQDKLLDRLFAVPRYKERYLAIVRDMSESKFTKPKLTERLDQIEQALREPLAREAKAVAARKEGTGGGGGGFGMGFGGGQFGQSMPPRKFIEKRTASIAAQLAGTAKGFEPKAFGAGPGGAGPVGRPPGGPGPGFGPGFGRPPGGASPAKKSP